MLTLCKPGLPDRLRHSLYNIDNTLACPLPKVKCIYDEDCGEIEILFVQIYEGEKYPTSDR